MSLTHEVTNVLRSLKLEQTKNLSIQFGGDVLKDKGTVRVNPVNCAGTMGNGLALGFKMYHPQNFRVYMEMYERGELLPGLPFMTIGKDTKIINLPVKDDWRNDSRIEWIAFGLRKMLKLVTPEDVVLIPLVGCGHGGLSIKAVLVTMHTILKESKATFIICVR